MDKSKWERRRSLMELSEDAIGRDHKELAIAYQQAAIRLGFELIEEAAIRFLEAK